MQSQEVQKCVCSFQQHYDQSSTISRANWWLHDSPGTWGGLSCSHDLYSCSQLSNYCSAAAHCNWYLVAPAAENNPNLFKHSSIFNYEWLHNKLNPGKQSWKKFQNTIIRRLQNVDMDRTFYTVHTGQAILGKANIFLNFDFRQIYFWTPFWLHFPESAGHGMGIVCLCSHLPCYVEGRRWVIRVSSWRNEVPWLGGGAGTSAGQPTVFPALSWSRSWVPHHHLVTVHLYTCTYTLYTGASYCTHTDHLPAYKHCSLHIFIISDN